MAAPTRRCSSSGCRRSTSSSACWVAEIPIAPGARMSKVRAGQGDRPLHILIIGAAGMVGRKLTGALVKTDTLGGRPIEKLTLVDVVAPTAPKTGAAVETLAADLSAPNVAATLAAKRP